MGIRKRFGLIMIIVSFITLCAISVATYLLSVEAARTEASRKADIIFRYNQAARKYFREMRQPLVTELVEKYRFHPEFMSGFALTRMIADNVQETLPGYTIKNASVNPLLKSDRADRHEIEITRKFKAEIPQEPTSDKKLVKKQPDKKMTKTCELNTSKPYNAKVDINRIERQLRNSGKQTAEIANRYASELKDKQNIDHKTWQQGLALPAFHH